MYSNRMYWYGMQVFRICDVTALLADDQAEYDKIQSGALQCKSWNEQVMISPILQMNSTNGIEALLSCLESKR